MFKMLITKVVSEGALYIVTFTSNAANASKADTARAPPAVSRTTEEVTTQMSSQCMGNESEVSFTSWHYPASLSLSSSLDASSEDETSLPLLRRLVPKRHTLHRIHQPPEVICLQLCILHALLRPVLMQARHMVLRGVEVLYFVADALLDEHATSVLSNYRLFILRSELARQPHLKSNNFAKDLRSR